MDPRSNVKFILLIVLFSTVSSITVGSISNVMFISKISQMYVTLSEFECSCIASLNSSIGWNYLPVNKSCYLIPNYSSNDIGINGMNTATFFFVQSPPSYCTNNSIAESASVLYKFDGTSNDYYGNYNAVAENGPIYISPGYNGRGSAIKLQQASSQYLTIANFMNFYNRSFTIEAWIYPASISTGSSNNDAIIYAQQSNSTSHFMIMQLRNGSVHGDFYSNEVMGSTVLNINRWQHVAFTYDYFSMTQTVYVNGVVDAVHTNSPPCLLTAGYQTIGRYPLTSTRYFDGYIDQLIILFNRSKATAEILADATLVAYYSMNNLSDIGWDSGPNQINGNTSGIITGVNGRIGQSYLFNSSSSYFQARGFILLGQSYSPYSFAIWIKPLVSTSGIIVHVSENENGGGWCLPFLGFNPSGQIVTQNHDGTNAVSVFGPVITPHQWTHIAISYSSTNGLRLYTNGTFYAQNSAFTYVAKGSPMFVALGYVGIADGCGVNTVDRTTYYGQMDEFYIFSRELSPADVWCLAHP